MNYLEIKQDYPKAWEALLDFATGYHLDHSGELINEEAGWVKTVFPFRDLYEFFDENGLFVAPLYVQFMEARYKAWAISVHKASNNVNNTIGEWFNTRTEAEQVGFKKAFEILNERL